MPLEGHFYTAANKPFSLYTSHVKNDANHEDLIGFTWKKMVTWSNHYEIEQPFNLNKNVTQKDLKHFFYCLENKISLEKDRPILNFKASSKNDLIDYQRFLDFIYKLYSKDSDNFSKDSDNFEWDEYNPSEFNNVKKGEVKIKKYKIWNKKDNNFIQKMLLQSVFYKMKECREYQKRVLKGSI